MFAVWWDLHWPAVQIRRGIQLAISQTISLILSCQALWLRYSNESAQCDNSFVYPQRKVRGSNNGFRTFLSIHYSHIRQKIPTPRNHVFYQSIWLGKISEKVTQGTLLQHYFEISWILSEKKIIKVFSLRKKGRTAPPAMFNDQSTWLQGIRNRVPEEHFYTFNWKSARYFMRRRVSLFSYSTFWNNGQCKSNVFARDLRLGGEQAVTNVNKTSCHRQRFYIMYLNIAITDFIS